MPELASVVADDFRVDSRDDFQIAGDHAWTPGALVLHNGAILRREFPDGAWTRIEMEIDMGPTENENSNLKVWLELKSATNCYVQFTPKGQIGARVLSVTVADTNETNDELGVDILMSQAKGHLNEKRRKLEILRHSTRDTNASVDGARRIVIEYRYGLVRVSLQDEEIFRAYLGRGDAAVSAIRLAAEELSCDVSHMQILTRHLTQQKPNATQQQLLDLETKGEQLHSLYADGKLSEAVETGRQILEDHRQIHGKNNSGYAIALNNLASMCKNNGAYDEAEPYFREALEIYKVITGADHPDCADVEDNLGLLRMAQNDFPEARSLFEQALKTRRLSLGESHPACADSLRHLGMLFYTEGRYSRAQSLFLEALEIRKKFFDPNDPDYLSTLNEIGATYLALGDYSEAERYLLLVREGRKEQFGVESEEYARSLGNLGVLYEQMGEYSRAERCLVEASGILKKSSGASGLDYATSLSNLALLFISMTEFGRAEPLLLDALAIEESILGSEDLDVANTLSHLAELYRAAGDYERARETCSRALTIRRNLLGADHRDCAGSLSNLAAIHEEAGDLLLAEPLYAEACEVLSRESGGESSFHATTMLGLSDICAAIGRYEQAQSLCADAIELRLRICGPDHPYYAWALNHSADLHRQLGENDSALQLYRQSHEILLKLGSRMLPSLSEAQSIIWARSHQPRADPVLTLLRQLEVQNGAIAYQFVWETKSFADRMRLSQTQSGSTSPESQAVFAELRDARQSLAKLVAADPSSGGGTGYHQALQDANHRKEKIEKQLAELNPYTRRAVSIRDATVAQLLDRLPPGTAVIDFALMDDSDFVEKQRELKNPDGTKETRTVHEESWIPVYDAFVLRSDRSRDDQVHWVSLGEAGLIDTAVQHWREVLANDGAPGDEFSSPDQSTLSRELIGDDPRTVLRQCVWDKLEPHLDGCHSVIILPDGLLHRLPWVGLPGRAAGTFLLEDYAISTASYGQHVFGWLSSEPLKSPEVLLLSSEIDYDHRRDPKGLPIPFGESVRHEFAAASQRSTTLDFSDNHPKWSFLKGAALEAREVSHLWGDRGPLSLLAGVDADEAIVKLALQQSRFSHFPTHGFFERGNQVYRMNLREQSLFRDDLSSFQNQASVAARNPLLMTGLVMAGANLRPVLDASGIPISDDGILTAEEIAGLNLGGMELVTLSACETGLGDVANGLGVFGLSRAFHQAGARSVVASLWKVDDRATQELMTQFYTNLWIKKQSKIDALRNAQLFLLRNPVLPDGTHLTRGDINKAKPVVPDPATTRDATDPYFWAAWTLSGDWR